MSVTGLVFNGSIESLQMLSKPYQITYFFRKLMENKGNLKILRFLKEASKLKFLAAKLANYRLSRLFVSRMNLTIHKFNKPKLIPDP